MQTCKQALVESTLNALWGFISAICLQLVLLPMYGIELNMQQNLELGLFFTALAIMNNFLFRRAFNYLTFKNKT